MFVRAGVCVTVSQSVYHRQTDRQTDRHTDLGVQSDRCVTTCVTIPVTFLLENSVGPAKRHKTKAIPHRG